jgi:FMN phosphatase YigB (HAD superfamily)
MSNRWNAQKKARLIVERERQCKTEFESGTQRFETIVTRLNQFPNTDKLTNRACWAMWARICKKHWPEYNDYKSTITSRSGIYALRFDGAPELGEAVSRALRDANMPPLGEKLVLVSNGDSNSNFATLTL